jgi:hypothetical protein
MRKLLLAVLSVRFQTCSKLNQPKVCGICVGAVLSWPREDWRHLPEHLAGDICGGSEKTIIEQKMGIE